VFCGEFGVYIPNSDDSSRVFWYETVRQLLEESGIAWTIWDYHGGFGVFEPGGNDLFEHDLNTDLLQALDFTVPAQTEYELLPDSTGFLVYGDFVGERINLSSNSDGRVNLYAEHQPNNGQYCLYWAEAQQYNTISFNFAPDKDLSQLVAEDYTLSMLIRGTDPTLRFDIRWVDTNQGEADLPWRMGVTIDETSASFDRYWHVLQIPLDDFVEQGAWDGEWYPPEGKFDWSAVDRLEIVAERQNFGNAQLWFDNILLTNQDTVQVLEPNAFDQVITALPSEQDTDTSISLYPNPASSFIQIFGKPNQHYLYQIMNASGQTMEQSSFNDATELSTTELSPGMYLIHIVAENGKQSSYRFLVH
ncbi:MAG: T9SS type A sorting domain-containing protein, partial [Bacteroidota bacterium]